MKNSPTFTIGDNQVRQCQLQRLSVQGFPGLVGPWLSGLDEIAEEATDSSSGRDNDKVGWRAEMAIWWCKWGGGGGCIGRRKRSCMGSTPAAVEGVAAPPDRDGGRQWRRWHLSWTCRSQIVRLVMVAVRDGSDAQTEWEQATSGEHRGEVEWGHIERK